MSGASEVNGEIVEFISPHSPCPYLADKTSSLRYRQFVSMSADQYVGYLERGWRRHGILFFCPACPSCGECRSLRVDLNQFRLSKSQRRCLRRNADVQVQVVQPDFSAAHLELFRRYHVDMHLRRGWPDRDCDADEYISGFLLGEFAFAYEFQYWRDQQLIGVGLVDITSPAMSSVYFYHDPDWRPAAPGMFSILTEIQFGIDHKVPHYYLGYWIADCPSMAYKSRYVPHQLLQETNAATPVWEITGATERRTAHGNADDSAPSSH